MRDRLVTFNAGGSLQSMPAREASEAWARESSASGVLVAFIQEVPSDTWLEPWRPDYKVTLGPDRGWKVRSALITHESLSVEPVHTDDFPTLAYHGSYVAAARWLNSPIGECLLASVHASPNPAEPEAYGWPDPEVAARHGGDGDRYRGGVLWDSDLLLHTLGTLGRDRPLIAAGDFNEARGFDLDGETWGREYFECVSSHGLRSLTHERWASERPTHGHLQLDHVLYNDGAATLLDGTQDPTLGEWPGGDPGRVPDHRPVWASIAAAV